MQCPINLEGLVGEQDLATKVPPGKLNYQKEAKHFLHLDTFQYGLKLPSAIASDTVNISQLTLKHRAHHTVSTAPPAACRGG